MAPDTRDVEVVLEKLRRGLDRVKGNGRDVSLHDDLVDDLELDSLDAIDLMAVLETEFPTGVLDRLFDEPGQIRTVGDLVDEIVRAQR